MGLATTGTAMRSMHRIQLEPRRVHLIAALTIALAAASTTAAPAAAQESNFALTSAPPPPLASGWTITPAMVFQGAWDDNALLRGNGDEAPGDFISLLNPRGDVNFLGRRGQFDASYDGSFVLYRDLNGLNSYDQHGSVSARRLITRHVTLWGRNTFVTVPTTELLNFIAVPFVRTGSKLDDLSAGFDAALDKFTSVTAAYNFQWVKFDASGPVGTFFLRGGHSNGATFTLKRALSERLSLIGGYSFQYAQLVNGGTFNIQSGEAGVEYRRSDHMRAFGAAGISRLSLSELGPPRTGPAWRAGLTRTFRSANLDVTFSRSYVPAFGFGGTYQNEELAGHVSAPIGRRIYVRSSVARRSNEPLENTGLSLKSIWVEGAFGYALQPWAHLEAFYSGAHQTIDALGIVYSRNRIGFQIVTAKPMRVR